MFLKFAGAADLESWARGYRLAVTATADEAVVAGIGGYICQHSDELLAVSSPAVGFRAVTNWSQWAAR